MPSPPHRAAFESFGLAVEVLTDSPELFERLPGALPEWRTATHATQVSARFEAMRGLDGLSGSQLSGRCVFDERDRSLGAGPDGGAPLRVFLVTRQSDQAGPDRFSAESFLRYGHDRRTAAPGRLSSQRDGTGIRVYRAVSIDRGVLVRVVAGTLLNERGDQRALAAEACPRQHDPDSLNGDHARVQAYWLLLQRDDENGHPLVVAFGHYDDRLVRADGRWRIAQRHATVEATTAVPPSAETNQRPEEPR